MCVLDLTLAGDDWLVRLATPADNAELLRLLREVHMASDLDMTQERDPDFFALPRLHSDRYETVVMEIAGRLEAMATVVIREGWLDGAVQTVGYQCDTRATRRASKTRAVAAMLAEAQRRIGEEYGAVAGYMTIIDGNTNARRSMVERIGKAGFGTVAEHCPYDMVNVQLRWWPAGGAVEVPDDRAWPEVVDFLSRRQRERMFGYLLDEAELDRRFRTWPGLTREDVRVVRRAGRVAATAILWDSSPVKRTRALGYHRGMATTKRWYDRGAAVFGYPRLPEPGEIFRFRYLSHLEVEDDDPALLAQLLRGVWAGEWGKALHFVSLMVPRGSALNGAFGGFVVNRTPMTLYATAPRGGRYEGWDFRTARPGFEMALV